MRVVPQGFYSNPGLQKIMVDGLCSVIYKSVDQVDSHNERYLSSHALTLVLNGGLIIEGFEGAVCKVHKNQLIFLPKGLYMISDIIPADQPFQALVFFFDEEVADNFLSFYEDNSKVTAISNLILDYNEQLRLFVDNTLLLYGEGNQHQFTRVKLLELLHLIARSNKGNEFVHALFEIRKKEKKSIAEFMEEHFDKPLDIEDYAYLTGRSVSTFQRDFKRKYQTSPKKWLIGKRLEKAAELFKTSAYSVTLTMQNVGYQNTSHFIKAFHKKFGISPKQYQIKHRNEVGI